MQLLFPLRQAGQGKTLARSRMEFCPDQQRDGLASRNVLSSGPGSLRRRGLQKTLVTALALGPLLLCALAPGLALADYQKGLEAYEKGDFPAALKEWQGAALDGDPKAQLGMGILHDTGRGVQANPTEAVRWYSMAAGQGVVTALYNLGRLYAEGRGVQKNMEEARRLWERAAQGGSQTAQHNLGVIYYRGEGVKQDYDAAYEWFQRGAETGYAESQYMLGEMHRLGLGTGKDENAAVRWLTLAELQGHQGAADRLRAMGIATGGEKTGEPAATGASPENAAQPDGNAGEPDAPDPAGAASANPKARPVSEAPTDVAGAGDGQYQIWLESFSTLERANAHWAELQKDLPDLFASLEPVILQVEVNGRTYFRLLTGPVQSREEAGNFCVGLKQRNERLNCRPIRKQ